MHIAEQGEGPAVVLCHGFPGLWYTWRHQLAALSAAGYRAIAPDMRGYGRTTAPRDAAAYDRGTTVGDLVGLLDALELRKAVFCGHDFGAHLVWDMPAWAADRVLALIQLSVPRTRRLPVKPSVGFNYLASQHFTHLEYFQEPGLAELELDAQPKAFLAALFHALSGANRYLDCWDHPARVNGKRNGYLDVLPNPLPCRGTGFPSRISTTTRQNSRGRDSPAASIGIGQKIWCGRRTKICTTGPSKYRSPSSPVPPTRSWRCWAATR